jgi:hypothetical protein
MKVGLRFRRGDARVLAALADQFGGRPGINERLYTGAAHAAKIGEPLLVEADSLDEVRQMAALFGHVGVRPPTIEEVSQA